MRRVVASVASVLLAVALGVGSAWVALQAVTATKWVTAGPWRTNLAIGSAQADPYTRATVALHGLFALSQAESVYYEASHDDDAQPLESRCTYRLEGEDLPARWWSITVYGQDGYLVPDAQHRYSVTQTSVARAADRAFTVVLSNTPVPGNWLPTGTERRFTLTARLYQPSPTVLANPSAVPLPRIRRQACP